jgi:hypothetical protein
MKLKFILLGLVPLVLVAGVVALLRYYAGSWERFFDWALKGFACTVVVGLLLGLAHGIGWLIWTGDHDEGRAGLSRVVRERREAKTKKAAAKAAAAIQDGQVSVADDAQGRLSVPSKLAKVERA